ncbi:MAG: acyltransferase family protein [Candidatus Nanopelagicales bacterium]
MSGSVAARPEPPRPAPAPEPAASWRFRPDVEGLRAVAIVAVVGYHVGLPLFGGGFVGVDVFFVISGFLITGLLVAEAQGHGHVSLARFWARRARRLLPAATLVLAVVALASWFALPRLDHRGVGLDVVASALYVSNLRFAAQATDYLGAVAPPSPVLHFWSLGVEEQFYLVWPLLVLAVALLARRRALRGEASAAVRRRHLAIALAVLGAASFLLSLRLTDRAQPWAFFGMPTRAWEFALGGLLAIGALEAARVPVGVRRAAGWLGGAVLLASVVLVDGDRPYPGTQALWPVLGTTALILAGTTATDRATSVPRLLAAWPMRALGRLSYSWYLWHWPALVLAVAVWGELSTGVLLLVALVMLVPAALSYRFVETPVRHSPALVASSRRSLLLGLALSVSAALCGGLLAVAPGGGSLASGTPAPAVEDDTGRGAAPAADDLSASPTAGATTAPTARPVVWPTGPLTPDPAQARDDLPAIYSDGCHLSITATSSPTCAFGETGSATTVVLLGDSHAAQWFPTLKRLADKNGWRLLVRTKSGCPAPDVTILQRRLKRAYDECDTWRSAVLDEIVRTKPALVVAAGTRTDSLVDRASGDPLAQDRAGAEWKAGWRRTLSPLEKAGVTVAVLRDTPWPGKDMASCVAQHESRPSTCDLSRKALDSPAYDVATTNGSPTAHGVDLSDVICAPTRCPATQGKYLVYRDESHLTATFARALAPYLDKQLAPLLP